MKMDRETLIKHLAPCGLSCYTCGAAKYGVIKQHSQILLKYLENFDMFAERLSEYEPQLENYPQFKVVLQLMGDAGCEGCRDGDCKYPGCTINLCVKEKGVDFCFECASFPCDKADFDPILKSKWLRANERMMEIGAEAYFEEDKQRSHYALASTQ